MVKDTGDDTRPFSLKSKTRTILNKYFQTSAKNEPLLGGKVQEDDVDKPSLSEETTLPSEESAKQLGIKDIRSSDDNLETSNRIKDSNLDAAKRNDNILNDKEKIKEAIELVTFPKSDNEAQQSPIKLDKDRIEKPVKPERKKKINKNEFVSKDPVSPQKSEETEKSVIESTEIPHSSDTVDEIPSTSNDEQQTIKEEDQSVLVAVIHGCDSLRESKIITKLVVKVHIFDLQTGNYIIKKSNDRSVTSYYESSNIKCILPILTKPFDVLTSRTMSPVWEDPILFNESFEYILSKEPLFIFEILDVPNDISSSKSKFINKGWNHLAWAFLKLKGANGKLNSGKRIRLQLYKPIKNKLDDPFKVWNDSSRKVYNSTLYVTIKAIAKPIGLKSTLRSMCPTQSELSDSGILKETISLEKQNSRRSILQMWNRLPSQPCHIPTTLLHTLRPASKGCFIVKFSNNGKFLACGSRNDFNHTIDVYSFPSGEKKSSFYSHSGLIYDLDWTHNDKFLMSASADCSVKIWDTVSFNVESIVVLPHPAFVYCSKFHNVVDNIVITGCYDTIIRLWTYKSNSVPMLVQELEAHKNHINSICLSPDGNKLYSADSIGKILVWNAYFTEQPSKKGVARDWTKYSEITHTEFEKQCINTVQVHPSGHKLLVHIRNNSLKMFDLRVNTITVRFDGLINYQDRIICAMTPCGSFVYSGSEDGIVHVWRCDTGEKVMVYSDLPFNSHVSAVHFHPHDNYLAMCSMNIQSAVLVYQYQFEIDESMSTSLKNSRNLKKELTPLSKKHVSFDDDVTKSVRFQKAMKKLDSVRDNMSLSMKSSPNDSSFLTNSSISSFSKSPVKVSLLKGVRTPSFNFKIPSNDSVSTKTVRTLHNYNAARSDELSFNAGELIRVIFEDSDSWWMGELESNGLQGFFPVNYVRTE